MSIVIQHFHYSKVTSTNDVALLMAKNNAAEGTMITADEQTAGRGQRGHKWFSPANKALYYSIILRPNISAKKISLLTLMAGIAVEDTLSSKYNLQCELKWINDILLHGKKVAGILTESTWHGSNIKFVIIGIGINLVIDKKEFPSHFKFPPTSIEDEETVHISKKELTNQLTEKLIFWYSTLINLPSTEIISNWLNRSSMLGKQILFNHKNSDFIKGCVKGLNEFGHLILELENGKVVTYNSGSVDAIFS